MSRLYGKIVNLSKSKGPGEPCSIKKNPARYVYTLPDLLQIFRKGLRSLFCKLPVFNNDLPGSVNLLTLYS